MTSDPVLPGGAEPEIWTCTHCGAAGGALGGPGQTWTVAGQDVWLHQRCEAAYHEAHVGDPPRAISDSPEDRRELPDWFDYRPERPDPPPPEEPPRRRTWSRRSGQERR